MAVIEAHKLRKVVGTTVALDNVDLAVRVGNRGPGVFDPLPMVSSWRIASAAAAAVSADSQTEHNSDALTSPHATRRTGSGVFAKFLRATTI